MPKKIKSPKTGQFSGHITLGARGDSYYEYLLKRYIQSGHKQNLYKEMYEKALHGIVTYLVDKTPSGETFVAELIGEKKVGKMDHLVCFLPGTLALGVTNGRLINPKSPPESWSDFDKQIFKLAEELVETCHHMYTSTPTGIAGEIVHFSPEMMTKPADSHNILRPETVESYFVMWRVTHDPKYREWAWEAFESWRRYARFEGGYCSLKSVLETPPTCSGKMESFWLAETLKYLYLTFSGDELVDLTTNIINTEAHPFPILF